MSSLKVQMIRLMEISLLVTAVAEYLVERLPDVLSYSRFYSLMSDVIGFLHSRAVWPFDYGDADWSEWQYVQGLLEQAAQAGPPGGDAKTAATLQVNELDPDDLLAAFPFIGMHTSSRMTFDLNDDQKSGSGSPFTIGEKVKLVRWAVYWLRKTRLISPEPVFLGMIDADLYKLTQYLGESFGSEFTSQPIDIPDTPWSQAGR